jgi:hypothetical protein
MDAVRAAARRLRAMSVRLALESGSDPVALYMTRLGEVEKRNVLSGEESFDGPRSVPPAPTWRDLQRSQMDHDRYYHPDVLGLSKLDQLRHYALHVSKLSGAVASTLAGDVSCDDLVARRVPDMLIFGIKLSTVVGERLPSEPVTRAILTNQGAAAARARAMP